MPRRAQTALIKRDARKLPPCPSAPYDLIFLDPPYAKGLGESALSAALAGNWIAPGGALIVWEESAAIAPPPDGITPLDTRRYGDTNISLLRATPG